MACMEATRVEASSNQLFNDKSMNALTNWLDNSGVFVMARQHKASTMSFIPSNVCGAHHVLAHDVAAQAVTR